MQFSVLDYFHYTQTQNIFLKEMLDIKTLKVQPLPQLVKSKHIRFHGFLLNQEIWLVRFGQSLWSSTGRINKVSVNLIYLPLCGLKQIKSSKQISK